MPNGGKIFLGGCGGDDRYEDGSLVYPYCEKKKKTLAPKRRVPLSGPGPFVVEIGFRIYEINAENEKDAVKKAVKAEVKNRFPRVTYEQIVSDVNFHYSICKKPEEMVDGVIFLLFLAEIIYPNRK